jgi:xanthosine utilization system XapX-like protein
MLPFCLYFVTGLVTGFHIYTLLALAVYGVPINALELISLLGSLGFLIAAYVSLFKPLIAAKLALIAALAMWSFYGPAIANLVRARLEHRKVGSVISSEVPFFPGFVDSTGQHYKITSLRSR